MLASLVVFALATLVIGVVCLCYGVYRTLKEFA